MDSFCSHQSSAFRGSDSPEGRSLLWLAGLALVITGSALAALIQFDYTILLFIRSFQDPVLDTLGRIGNRLGHGSTLIFVSLGLWAIGFFANLRHFQQAGWRSLMAHGVAGLAAQILKHSLGRPRPRWTHQDHWQIGPSLESGLDAFPSGHATASFAVAAVLASYFPWGRGIWYGLAGFVALSRVVKGSHFFSDVLAGALLGYLIGVVTSRPWSSWRISLSAGLIQGLPYWLGGFSLIWVIYQQPDSGPVGVGLFWLGMSLTILGAVLHLGTILRPQHSGVRNPGSGPQETTAFLTAGGLALFTESLLIAFLACLTLWAFRLGRYTSSNTIEDKDAGGRVRKPDRLRFAILAAPAFLILLHHLKGLIPLR